MLLAPGQAGAGRKRTGKVLWGGKNNWTCRSFVVAPGALLAAGPIDKQEVLAAVSLKDGSKLWTQRLDAESVLWGTAVDRAGRIFVSLVDGRVVCYAGAGG